MTHLIFAPEAQPFTGDRAQISAAAQARWPGQTTEQATVDPDDTVDFWLEIAPVDQSPFHIFHFREGDALSTDGTPAQVIEVAAWVMQTFPAAASEQVWLTDEAYTFTVTLTSSITERDIALAWSSAGA